MEQNGRSQTDLANLLGSRSRASEILSGVDGIAFVQFTHADVVRHKLVQRIVEAYKLHAEETGTERRR